MSNVSQNIRTTAKWSNIFKLVTNNTYTPRIIDILISAKDIVKLTSHDLQYVHDAYDNRILFQAIGCSIQASNTEGVKTFVDIIYNYWSILEFRFPEEIREFVKNGYPDL